MIKLKSSKESRDFSRGIIIEIFEHFGGDLCPVDAYEKYLVSCGGSKMEAPAFRVRSGNGYRHSCFNKELKQLLEPALRGYGKISAHSFRVGLATLLAAAGYSDDMIKAIGRWSSEAFLRYAKLTRLIRVSVAQKLKGLYKYAVCSGGDMV